MDGKIPPKIICWNLTSKIIVLGDGNLCRWLSHEGGALISEINALINKNSSKAISRPSHPLRLPLTEWCLHNRKLALTRHHVCPHLNCGTSASRAVRNTFYCPYIQFMIFFIAAQKEEKHYHSKLTGYKQ